MLGGGNNIQINQMVVLFFFLFLFFTIVKGWETEIENLRNNYGYISKKKGGC